MEGVQELAAAGDGVDLDAMLAEAGVVDDLSEDEKDRAGGQAALFAEQAAASDAAATEAIQVL